MFCTNCGAKVADNIKFCAACGAPLQQENQSISRDVHSEQLNQQQQVRTEALRAMDRVASLIPAIEPDWNSSLQMAQKAARMNGARVRKGMFLPFIIPGGVCFVFFMMVTRFLGPLALFFAAFSFAMVGAGIFFIIYENSRAKRLRSQASTLTPQINACFDRIYKVYSANQLDEYYPFKYFVPDCIRGIRDNIVNFRADTIKESINIYEQSQFYLQMMQQNSQMLRMMEYIAEQTRSIAVNTAW